MQPLITEYPNYFTATNLEWKKLLQPDKYKDIVISSMKFLVKERRVKIFSFVIMDNHIHLTCLPAGRYGKCFLTMTRKQCNGIS
jgi:putative transposase